jgi:N-acetyl-alpha-D-muramate 1-phosphate uridylyltransferase
MKAMLLAAGSGERMRPLTQHTPKPLLCVAGKPLLAHHIRRLAEAGFTELVINVSHLAQQVVDYCGDGSRWGVSITWSHEPEPLETAGGTANALPLLGDAPFLVVNADIWTDYPFGRLVDYCPENETGALLVMVDSPEQHPQGDFALGLDGYLSKVDAAGSGLTYAGIAVFTPGFFAGVAVEKLPLRPLLDQAIEDRRLQGEHYQGEWVDVGTPDRLNALDAVQSLST